MGRNAKDLTGQRFGKLVAVRPTDERQGSSIVWECKCDCGNTAFASVSRLTSGDKKSCGCVTGKDLTGQRFGKLVAVRSTEERKDRSVVWECKCDCGNTVFVSSFKLTRGKRRSCGCLFAKRMEDITGQRFGRLTAIRPTEEKYNNNFIWECRCDCGNTTFVQSSQLKNGNTQSCGCFAKDKAKKNLTGQRFGKLVAVRPTEERHNGNVVWGCICDCGNTVFVPTTNLIHGSKKSCGCLRKSNK